MSLYNFYRSKEFTNLRLNIIHERTTDFLYCEHCNKPILRAYDCIAHHTIYLTEQNYTDYNISLNPELIQLVHHRCHNKIHNKLGYSNREVYLVYGSPLSGKSSYVESVLESGDLVIDIDNIWQCVSGQSRYVKPNRLKSVVFSVRDNLLESVKYRRGKWNTAYVIGGYPYEAERNRLLDELGAKPILIDTPQSECLERLNNSDRDITEWTKYINDWWLQYKGGY
jgi:predicted kinase